LSQDVLLLVRIREKAVPLAILLAGCAANTPAARIRVEDSSRSEAVAARVSAGSPEDPALGGRDYWEVTPQRPEVVVAFERMGGHCGCPMYKVTLLKDGRVEYFGLGNVAQVGRREGHVEPPRLAELLQFAQAAHFFQETDHVRREHTDDETGRLYVRFNGQERTVTHYHGDHLAPERLERLERFVDRTVDIEKWVGLDNIPEERRSRAIGYDVIGSSYGMPPDMIGPPR
jgi:hypothetical protein